MKLRFAKTVLLFFATLFLVGVATSASAFVVYIPHMTSGYSDWIDYLEVDNTSLASVTFTLTLYNEGTQVHQGTYTVGIMGELLLDLKTLQTGSAETSTATCGRIEYSEEKLNFRLAFENAAGGLAEFRLSDELSGAQAFYFSTFTNTVEWKGVAIANMGSTTASVTLYAFGGGTFRGWKTVSIDGNSRLVGTYGTWFDDVSLNEITKIVAVTTSPYLTGIVISGNLANSNLLFTASVPLSSFSYAIPVQNDLTGTWRGTWTSTNPAWFGESGNVTFYMTQDSETAVSGTADLSDTDCGDLTGIPFTGTVSGMNITFSASAYCPQYEATGELQFTQGVITGNTISGRYTETVNGAPYDNGIFSVTRTQ